MSEFDIKLIWPSWELEGSLGRGPFGEVFLASDNFLAETQWCVIKIITMPPKSYNKEVAAGKREIVNFAKYQDDLTWEMTMFRTIEASGLIKPDEMWLKRNDTDTGWVCAVRMGLYTPVEDYFGKYASDNDVIRMGKELCVALKNSSDSGIVHGDIKPANIMVGDDGKFFISDFGIRKCLNSAGVIVFDNTTRDYDAPEVEHMGKFFAESDIYSVGMCMAYVLNGCVMPTGKNFNLIKCSNAELMRVLKKATSYDLKERYKNAGDMLMALDRIKANDELKIYKVSALENAKKKIEKYNKNTATKEENSSDENMSSNISSFFNRLFRRNKK